MIYNGHNLGVTSTLGSLVRLYYKDDSRCELESTGFSCQIAVTKPKIKSTSHQTKINVTS